MFAIKQITCLMGGLIATTMVSLTARVVQAATYLYSNSGEYTNGTSWQMEGLFEYDPAKGFESFNFEFTNDFGFSKTISSVDYVITTSTSHSDTTGFILKDRSLIEAGDEGIRLFNRFGPDGDFQNGLGLTIKDLVFDPPGSPVYSFRYRDKARSGDDSLFTSLYVGADIDGRECVSRVCVAVEAETNQALEPANFTSTPEPTTALSLIALSLGTVATKRKLAASRNA